MATIFSKIIAGELPGRFVWQDERCVAFLSAGPMSDGHTLVVPRDEIDEWTDAPEGLLAHLSVVAQRIGKAAKAAFESKRAGLVIAGFEVDHLHLHVYPVNSLQDFDFSRAETNPDPARLDANAEKLRAQLRELGWADNVPEA